MDALIVVWVAAWLMMGLATASEVRGLRELSGTLREVGQAVERSGQTLGTLSRVPFVGDELRAPAEEVAQAGRSIRESGRTSRDSIRSLATLLGVSIAVIPSVPVLAFYVPWRVALRRERRALARAVRLHGGDPAFERYLAFRAAHRRALHELQPHCSRPWQALADRDYRALADAELAASGIGRLPDERP